MSGVRSDSSPTEDLDEHEQLRLRSWLDHFLTRRVNELPRPPGVALEVLALSNKPTARMEDIAALLEREPMLSGKVLKLANSALYGSAVPCVTLKQALVRMGLVLVRDVVMEAAMQMTTLRAVGFDQSLESIRRHSSGMAWISRFVARNTQLETDSAFLLGLLHDVGLSYALIGVSEFLASEHRPLRLTGAAWRVADAVHQRFSAEVLKSWGLPPSVCGVTLDHHQLVLDGRPHPQAAVLLIAEEIAFNAGWDVQPTVEGTDEVIDLERSVERGRSDLVPEALETLSLTPRHFELISNDVKRVLQTLEGHFNHKR